MADMKVWLAGAADEAAGLAKRALGELTARPDLVIEGERQQVQGRAEAAAARDADASADRRTIGWKVSAEQRPGLLAHFPPRYAETIADHVTLAADAPANVPLPPDVSALIVGQTNDGKGVQALVVAINGHIHRPDGGIYHVTWSLAPGRHAGESNAVLASLGWRPLAAPRPLRLYPSDL